MAISEAKKEEIIDTFLVTKKKGSRLQITLRFQGRKAEADEVGKQNKRLSSSIDKLIAQSMRQWRGSASQIIADRKKGNAKLQASIKDIKVKKKVAENVVKALGYIDDAIETAAKLVA